MGKKMMALCAFIVGSREKKPRTPDAIQALEESQSRIEKAVETHANIKYKFCGSCGTVNDVNNKFCSFCGDEFIAIESYG
jgi:hypothetical protein